MGYSQNRLRSNRTDLGTLNDLGFIRLLTPHSIPRILSLEHAIDDNLLDGTDSVVGTSAVTPFLVMLSVTFEWDGGRADIALLDGGRHDGG